MCAHAPKSHIPTPSTCEYEKTCTAQFRPIHSTTWGESPRVNLEFKMLMPTRTRVTALTCQTGETLSARPTAPNRNKLPEQHCCRQTRPIRPAIGRVFGIFIATHPISMVSCAYSGGRNGAACVSFVSCVCVREKGCVQDAWRRRRVALDAACLARASACAAP